MRLSRSQDCALVGGSIGFTGGVIYAAAKEDIDVGTGAAAIGGGLVGGALVAYLVCVATDTGP